MEFIAYRFDCWPIELAATALGLEMDDVDGRANFDRRIEIINSFFSQEECRYTLGDGSAPLFKKGCELEMRRYMIKKCKEDKDAEANSERQRCRLCIDDSMKETDQMGQKPAPSPTGDKTIEEDEIRKLPKSEHDLTYTGRMMFHHDGVTILRVQKKHELKGEDKNFRKVNYSNNYASQMAILIARSGLQYLFVENSHKAFSPATLSYIIESTLNRLLMVRYNVMLQVSPVCKLSDFWQALSLKQQSGIAVKKLHFRFGYPNMPWPDDLLGGRFKKLGMELNADADIILKGQHGQPLKVNTKSGERDADINSMARYCCDRDNRLVTTFTDGSVTSFGYRQTGDVYLTLPDKLNDLQTSQQALPLDNKSISEEIALKAKNVKNMNEGV